MRLLASLVAISLLSISAFAQVFVATKQVQLRTKTFLFKLPVEAQRGERWEVVKRGKNNVSLTFGPNDERRNIYKSIGMSKVPEYELDAKVFANGFVPESEWVNARQILAAELHKRIGDLSIEQCEKVIDGELWIGMSKEAATEAVGNRIFSKERRETADGQFETWRVGAFSMVTTAKSTADSYVFQDSLLASPSRPMEPLDVKAARDLEANTRVILSFKNGSLTEIIRK